MQPLRSLRPSAPSDLRGDPFRSFKWAARLELLADFPLYDQCIQRAIVLHGLDRCVERLAQCAVAFAQTHANTAADQLILLGHRQVSICFNDGRKIGVVGQSGVANSTRVAPDSAMKDA